MLQLQLQCRVVGRSLTCNCDQIIPSLWCIILLLKEAPNLQLKLTYRCIRAKEEELHEVCGHGAGRVGVGIAGQPAVHLQQNLFPAFSCGKSDFLFKTHSYVSLFIFFTFLSSLKVGALYSNLKNRVYRLFLWISNISYLLYPFNCILHILNCPLTNKK